MMDDENIHGGLCILKRQSELFLERPGQLGNELASEQLALSRAKNKATGYPSVIPFPPMTGR